MINFRYISDYPMPRIKRENRTTEEKQSEFLEAFEGLANVTQAAEQSKIHRRTVYYWIKNDPDFKARYEVSYEIALGVLEDEATRRAVQGVDKPVYYQGKNVGTMKEYSDTLLIFLMKGNMPDKYKDRVQNEHSGIPAPAQAPQVNVYNTAPPLADSEDKIEE